MSAISAGAGRRSAAAEAGEVRQKWADRHQLVVIWRCFRPWGVFDVYCEDMKGVQKGLDWVLDHVGRKNK